MPLKGRGRIRLEKYRSHHQSREQKLCVHDSDLQKAANSGFGQIIPYETDFTSWTTTFLDPDT